MREANLKGSKVPTELFKEKEQLEEELKKKDANTISITFVMKYQDQGLMISMPIPFTLIRKFSSPRQEIPPIDCFSLLKSCPLSCQTLKELTEEAQSWKSWLNLV